MHLHLESLVGRQVAGALGEHIDVEVHFGLAGGCLMLQQYVVGQRAGVLLLHVAELLLELGNLVFEVGNLVFELFDFIFGSERHADFR